MEDTPTMPDPHEEEVRLDAETEEARPERNAT
jgi:hypothetical protein